MNKKVLIISPYFVPVNAADMQRVRMSISYFSNYGWDATVVTVDPKFSDLPTDNMLIQSLPTNIDLRYVDAFDKKITSKFGLGSIALRSLKFYKQKVSELLEQKRYDLIFFSTTQFAVCALGPYWKKRYTIPYVIDMQDPWFTNSNYNSIRCRLGFKHAVARRLNKSLEAIAMNGVDGLMAVSQKYIDALRSQYRNLKTVPSVPIPFGAFEADLKIAADNALEFSPILSHTDINIVYIGRGGNDMHKAILPVFKAFKAGLESQPEWFQRIRFYFIGTSYAPKGKGEATVLPLAKQFDIEDHVTEMTDRIGYYHTLNILQSADALFIPGSDDPNYSASKIYPYLLTKKPLMAVFNSESAATAIFGDYDVKDLYHYDDPDVEDKVLCFLKKNALRMTTVNYNAEAYQKYSAGNMTRQQCLLFDEVLKKYK